MTMPVFVSGLELSRRFFHEVVRPLLTDAFPGLRYGAALLGPGSEVLGFDTEMSVDHDWGPRLFIFPVDQSFLYSEEDAKQEDAIDVVLRERLPELFAGFPVALPLSVEPQKRIMSRSASGPVRHGVIPITVRDFVRAQLGYDLMQPLEIIDWLTFPSHALGELVAGEIYQDDLGELAAMRTCFEWYPHDVWLYLLAAGWQRISQEEHLTSRAGSVGDELGSAIIGSRLVRDIMNLCFLFERRYAPYAKWFGIAFEQLRSARELKPLLWNVQCASDWKKRIETLACAYEVLARLQNELGVCQPLPTTVSPFHDRPFPVIHAEQFAKALVQQIIDPRVQCIAANPLIGGINQWSDNTDMEGVAREKIRNLYM